MTQILFVHVHALLAAIGTFALVTHSLQSKIASIWINMNMPVHDLAWPPCPQVSVSEMFLV